ncbi:MAG: ATP-binding domain-containing protein [Rhizonema sp. PD37]|nr:ATP-binding domain-containing protein [Rhizonema sp. PD37]
MVILPLYMHHYMMLTRNLFYTGLTCAKRLAITRLVQKFIKVIELVHRSQRFSL